MTLPTNINDLEKQKFLECDSKVAVRTSLCGDNVFRPSGLNIAGLITIVSINDSTWTALPITPLTDRNAICIQNSSGVEIKINYSSSIVGYVGISIPNNGQRYYDITENIVIYAKSSAGNVDVTVEEIS